MCEPLRWRQSITKAWQLCHFIFTIEKLLQISAGFLSVCVWVCVFFASLSHYSLFFLYEWQLEYRFSMKIRQQTLILSLAIASFAKAWKQCNSTNRCVRVCTSNRFYVSEDKLHLRGDSTVECTWEWHANENYSFQSENVKIEYVFVWDRTLIEPIHLYYFNLCMHKNSGQCQFNRNEFFTKRNLKLLAYNAKAHEN